MSSSEIKNATMLFGTYTLLGAMSEHILYYISGVKKTLSNPIITGFPIYGIGGLVIYQIRNVIITKFPNLPLIIEFLIYGCILSFIEYISGKIVGAGPKSYLPNSKIVESWDYSKNIGNIGGIIDVQHFIMFAIAGMIMSRINPYILNIVNC